MNKDYDWKNHFKLSQEMFEYFNDNNPLPNSGKASALSRTIIHAAYYSCLNITKENNLKYRQENQDTGQGAHAHDLSQVIHYDIPESLDVDLKKLRNGLLQLKTYRTYADYKSDVQIDFYYTKQVMDRASNIYNDLIKLNNA